MKYVYVVVSCNCLFLVVGTSSTQFTFSCQ